MLSLLDRNCLCSAAAAVAASQDILVGSAKLTCPNSLKYNLPGRVDVGGEVTAKDIMIATGSVPFVPPGIPIDGKTVSTASEKLALPAFHCMLSHRCFDAYNAIPDRLNVTWTVNGRRPMTTNL